MILNGARGVAPPTGRRATLLTEKQALLAAARQWTVAAGTVLCRQDQPVDHVIVIRSGWIRVYSEDLGAETEVLVRCGRGGRRCRMIDREPPYVQIMEHFKQEISAGLVIGGGPAPDWGGRSPGSSASPSPRRPRSPAACRPSGWSPRCRGPGPSCPPPPPARSARRRPAGHPARLPRPAAARGPGPRPGRRGHAPAAARRRRTRRGAVQPGHLPPPRHHAGRRDRGAGHVLAACRAGRAAPDLLNDVPLNGDVAGDQPVWGEDWISARPPSMDETRTSASNADPRSSSCTAAGTAPATLSSSTRK